MTGLWVVLGVGLVVFMVFGGALLGMAVATAPEEQEAHGPSPLVSFQPVAWTEDMQQASVEQIVDDIERHLRKEGEAAAAFARAPSLDSLRPQ